MNAWTRRVALLLGLLFVSAASAVSLSTDGSGQVLIYPYYTVNAGQQSTLTLTNRASRPKAVKLMIREGAFGDAAFVLNVYLGAKDTWTGTVFQWGTGSNGGPALLSNDASCTVPDLHGDALPTLPDGRHYLRPNGGALSAGSVPDEGYVVAIEMGELSGNSAAAVLMQGFGGNPPADCGELVAAWQTGGYWRADPSNDVSAPTGGLAGSVTVVDSGEGSVFHLKATALKDFRVATMHTAPTTGKPDLGSALSNAANGVATATIRLGNTMVQSDYPADRAVDAVTAVLTARTLSTEFDFRPGVGARTDFVFTMPTKRFYTADPAHPVAPFGRDRFHRTSPRGSVCPIVEFNGADRNGSFSGLWYKLWKDYHALAVDGPKACYASSVIALDPASRPPSLLNSQLTAEKPLIDDDLLGQVAFDMGNYSCDLAAGCTAEQFAAVKDEVNLMRPDLQGRRYLGLPAIGFAATGYINAYAGNANVWRNLTFTSAYDRSRGCVQDNVVGGCH
ncbi:MAG TPA: hypothetical protein VFG73_00690 [Rhodanobacteraceae bacterium]|nr:hypothetical protein [Rhodanobacteraceae bacterium]